MAQWAYQMLDITPPSDLDTIEKRFRKLSKSCHPDLCHQHGLSPQEAQETFQSLSEACDTAKDYLGGKIPFYAPKTPPQPHLPSYPGFSACQPRQPQPSQVNTLSNGTVLVTGDMKPGEVFLHLFNNRKL
jgi:hypothetical protein